MPEGETGAEGAEGTQPGSEETPAGDERDPEEILAEMTAGEETEGSGKRQRTPEQTIAELVADRNKWKTRARENTAAAQRLQELEDAQKTEAQKLQERSAAAEERAVEADKRYWRTMAAARFELEPDLIPYLAGGTEEDIAASAETLARVINERVEKVTAGSGAAPPPNGARGGRPVESLRPGGAPAGGTATTDPNQMFRDFVGQRRR